ncbi:MAG: DUF1549 and DUF1553 domain-containing protein [Pirellulaceae bacterium]
MRQRAGHRRRRVGFHVWIVSRWLLLAAIASSAAMLGTNPRLRASEPSPAEVDQYDEPTLTESDRDHWAFRPLERPLVPSVANRDWPRNAIDSFVLAQLELRSLTPMPEADRATLLRRLSFDLRGIPPSPAEIADFVGDVSPDAYERLVERWLASPLYGERWAQHWLDLARFAETDGFEHDHVRGDAWRYRDWVIDALNADMPYDQFLQQQLAGDELWPDDERARRATAFCLAGPDMPDLNSQEERRQRLLTELASTVGAVVLGLQVGCAECHDHKYDPISQADFYRLRAIFSPAVQVKKNQSVDLLHSAKGVASVDHLLIRGDWQRPGPAVVPGVPRVANFHGEPLLGDSHVDGEVPAAGRRAALARWLTDSRNPLTSRVMANRVWQFHFGEGLSRTPSDFGLLGDEPLHGKLLDWLATELMARRWSLKSLHRTIVTSATYRQASRDQAESRDIAEAADTAVEAGPSESPPREETQHEELQRRVRLLWRFPRRRLEGEAIRDAMLACAGQLNFQQHGPGARPPLPSELVSTLLKDQWNVTPEAASHYRRSVYVFARRNLRYPIFEVFDRPDANASCAARNRSTTAPQSLLMLNSELALRLATQFADRLREETADRDHQVCLAFQIAFGRNPDPTELAAAHDLLATSNDAHQALVDLCLALFNANEFVYVD